MARTIVQRFLAIFSSNVIGLLATFLITPIIVRVFGSRLYGDYAFMLSVLGVLMLFVDAGVFDGLRKYLIESDRSPEWKDLVFAFYSRVAAALIAAVTVTIIILNTTGIIGRYLGEEFVLYFYVLAVLILAEQSFSIVRGTLMGFSRERASESLYIVSYIIFAVVGLGLVFSGFGVAGILAGRAISRIIVTIAGLVIISRIVDYSYLTSVTPDEFPSTRLLTFNINSLILFGLYVSMLHADIILIQFIEGSRSTGYYKAALTLAEFLWFVPRIVQIALLHSMSDLWSQGRDDEITAISARSTRYTLLFTILLTVGLGALADPTISTYYGNEFEPAVTPLLLLLPGALGFAAARPIFAIGQGKGELRYLIYATGTAALLNIVLNLLLIPSFGIQGAAVATSTGYMSMFVLHSLSAKKIGFDPLADLRLPRIAATACIAAIPIFLLAAVIRSDLLSLMIVPPVGLGAYAITAVYSGAVSVDEVLEIRNQL